MGDKRPEGVGKGRDGVTPVLLVNGTAARAISASAKANNPAVERDNGTEASYAAERAAILCDPPETLGFIELASDVVEKEAVKPVRVVDPLSPRCVINVKEGCMGEPEASPHAPPTSKARRVGGSWDRAMDGKPTVKRDRAGE